MGLGLCLTPPRLSSSARKARIELVLLRLVRGSSRLGLGIDSGSGSGLGSGSGSGLG